MSLEKVLWNQLSREDLHRTTILDETSVRNVFIHYLAGNKSMSDEHVIQAWTDIQNRFKSILNIELLGPADSCDLYKTICTILANEYIRSV